MSRIIYYLGAGASFGRRDRTKGIIEGLPIVSEIPKQFSMFRDYISKARIPESGYFKFYELYQRPASGFDMERQEMLSDIDELIKGVQEHATIDTYARKLYLTGKTRDFSELKDILCAFFLWAQLQYKPDGRYDAFLANVLDEKTLLLPPDISIVSWNYDSQIETSYLAYNRNSRLTVFEKNLQGEWPALPQSGRVLKINGSATFVNGPLISLIQDGENDMPVPLQLIEFYHNSRIDTSDLGVNFKTHLSFAWEVSDNGDKMQNTLANTLEDTEVVVVIGYSFPFFNRNMDRWVFKHMPNLKKVYVQDTNPTAVLQSLSAAIPVGRKLEVEEILNCEQFYLPSEL